MLTKLKELISKATFSEAYVTVCDNREALVENVSNVYDCNEIMVRLKAGSKDIVIWGEELKIKNCVNKSLVVYGKISSVEFHRGGNR